MPIDQSAYKLVIRPEHTHPAGLQLCDAASQKLGLYGATPVVQPAGAAQAAVPSTPIANAAGDAPDDDEFDALVARVNALTVLVNQLRADLVTLGAIKGAA